MEDLNCEFYSNNCIECLSSSKNCRWFVLESGTSICSEDIQLESINGLLYFITRGKADSSGEFLCPLLDYKRPDQTLTFIIAVIVVLVLTILSKRWKVLETIMEQCCKFKALLKAMKKPQVGTPKLPDPSLYQHLTEKERMLKGWPYNAADPELQKIRIKADKLNWEFNTSHWEDESGRREIIRKLFHPDCKDVNLKIEAPFRADFGENIIVGNNFYANVDCLILDCAKVEIGSDCMLGPGVHIYTVSHALDYKFRRDWGSPTYFEVAKSVKIGNDCWIGGKVVVCQGVTIGDNVVVGAGSVVTKNIPSNVVAAGNPCKVIRYLDKKAKPDEIQFYL